MAAKKPTAKKNKKPTTKVNNKVLTPNGASGSDEQPTDLNKSTDNQSAIDNEAGGGEAQANELKGSTTTDLESGGQTNPDNLSDAPSEQAAAAKSKQNLAPAGKTDKFTAECQKIAKRYSESYPTCNAFHFCSDMRVFLEGDLTEARSHQASLGKGQITTIKIR